MSEQGPVWSVVIPVRDGERYLADAIRSALALPGPAREVIVVDDGSRDGSRAIAESFGAPVRVVSGAGCGPAAARNVGLREARTDLLGFLDADDLWLPALANEALARLISDPEVDVAHGLVREFHDDAPASAGAPFRYILIGSAFFRRRAFERIGPFDETLLFCEDYDWFLRAFEGCLAKAPVDAVTLLRRLHAASMTKGDTNAGAGLAKAHRRAIERRRRGAVPAQRPEGFPSVVEYMGTRPAHRMQPLAMPDDKPEQPVATPEELGLERRDQRPIELAPDAVIAISCVRNEATRLPFQLAWHRRLGVARFLVIDNGSTDGTLDYLLGQPDVHVWHTTASFRDSRNGTDWMEALMRAHGVGRWCLVADADELFYYADCETRAIGELVRDLDASGAKAFRVLMLDMYADAPVREVAYRAGDDFRDACPYFDRRAFHTREETFFGHDAAPSVFGGVRERVFGGAAPGVAARHFYCLSKVPLLRYDPAIRLADSLHWTSCRELARETGCLLHFKFLASFAAQASAEAARGEHWNGAVQYARYAHVMAAEPALNLYSPEHSLRFVDSRQLVDLGIMEDGDDGHA